MSEKKVMTVCGPISPDDLGITMSHDHLLINSMKLVLIECYSLFSLYQKILNFLRAKKGMVSTH